MSTSQVFWYGDNLDVMREDLASDGDVDLIYLDPLGQPKARPKGGVRKAPTAAPGQTELNIPGPAKVPAYDVPADPPLKVADSARPPKRR